MKKFWIALTLLGTFTAVLTQAQTAGLTSEDPAKDDKKKKIDRFFELLGYVNCSTFTGESESYSGVLFGGQIGAQVQLGRFSDRFGVWVGAAYSMQGSKYGEDDGEPGAYNVNGSVRLNYLNFPIFARYQTKGRVYLEGGLQPGLLLSAKDKYEYTGTSGNSDIKDQFNSFDLGVPIGVGYKLNDNLGMTARVVPGITNINKKETTYSAPKDRNLVFSLGATYAF